VNRSKFLPTLLVLALCATVPLAQAATETPAAPANPVDPASVKALKDMGTYLLTLEHYQIKTELTGERVLMDGQKLQHSAAALIEVQRPNKLRATLTSPRSERELIYDGKTFTIYLPQQKYYSSVPFSENVAGLISKLEERYAVEIPLSDLFKWGTPAAPAEAIESAMNAGQDIVGDELCNHYAFRQGKYDWQIWIADGPHPLPRKLVITNRTDEERPQSVSLITWNLKPVSDNTRFTFTPPKGTSVAELHSVSKK